MTDYPKLAAIVAKSRNGVIGIDGDLPWRLSSDLQFFKRTTLGKPCLMGRKTWESLPFPLPGRPNLVLTRNAQYQAKGAEVFTALHDMIGRGFELAGQSGSDEVMLIGGAMLYAKMMPWLDRLYITEVDAMIEGDAHFPAVLASDWVCTAETLHTQGLQDDYPFVVREYERRLASRSTI